MVGPGVCRATVVAGGESNDLGGPRVVHYAYGITYTITHIIHHIIHHTIAYRRPPLTTSPIHPNRNPHPNPYFFTDPSPCTNGPSLLCPSR